MGKLRRHFDCHRLIWVGLAGSGLLFSACSAVQPQASPPAQQVKAESATKIDIQITLPTSPTPTVSAMPSLAPLAASPAPTPQATPTPLRTPVPTPTPVTVVSLKLTPLAKLNYFPGESIQLKAVQTLSDQSASAQLNWISSQPAVASVDKQGLVKTHRAGQVEILAISALDNTFGDKLTLTISNPSVNFSGKIVYVINHDLYLLKGSNMAPQRLTFDGASQPRQGPRFAWDGSRIVYQQRRQIFSQALADSSSEAHVIPDNEAEPRPFYGADGSLYFDGYGDPRYGTSQHRVWRFDAPNTVSMYSDKLQGFSQSSFAGLTPDNRLVYAQNNQITVTPYNNKESTLYLATGNEPRFALNPNPGLIVYTYLHNLKTVSFFGQINTVTDTAHHESQPALSPDESKIVFVSDQTGNPDLYMINVDGSGLVNLTNTPDLAESQPDWSP